MDQHQRKALGWFLVLLAFVGTVICGAAIVGGWEGVGIAFILIGGAGILFTLVAFADDWDWR